MYFRVGISYPAASLFFRQWYIQVGKADWIFIPFLFLHLGIVQTPAIYSGRSSGFKAVRFKPLANQLFSNTGSCFFSHSPAPKLLFTDMNDSIQKCSIR